jgi:hypothetical protein
MEPFPPEGFVPVPSRIEGIAVFAPAPEQQEAIADVIAFKCPQCLATTAYSVEDGGVRCAHCGYYEPPETSVVGKRAEAFEFTAEMVSAVRQAHGWGTQRREITCQSCGSQTSVPPTGLTHTCPFCGSNRVLQHDAPHDQLRPRFLVPFQVETTRCQALARTWLGSSWMTPKALKDAARVADFMGVYMPFWTFDARAAADWRAEVGHQVTERYYDSSSKTWKTRTKTVWRWESGRAHRFFDDLLVAGSTRLSHILLQRIQDFDTHALVPYAPSYLAGFMAHGYDVSLEAAWEQARQKMRAATQSTCRSQASTGQVRNFRMTLDFSEESWRYVLMPVYVAVYRYEGETYQVMINGQTGTIAGQRPVDWTKVWLAVGAMLAPGVLLGLVSVLASLLGAVLPPSLIVGGGMLILAVVLLIVGVVLAVITVGKAKAMDDV